MATYPGRPHNSDHHRRSFKGSTIHLRNVELLFTEFHIASCRTFSLLGALEGEGLNKKARKDIRLTDLHFRQQEIFLVSSYLGIAGLFSIGELIFLSFRLFSTLLSSMSLLRFVFHWCKVSRERERERKKIQD
jgi:hypothetical protein